MPKRSIHADTKPAAYPPCPKCGQQIKIIIHKDGHCFVGSHPTGLMLRDVCTGSHQDGTPFLKPEPRSARFLRDLKAKRRLNAAIKRHDKEEARQRSQPSLLDTEILLTMGAQRVTLSPMRKGRGKS